MQTDLPMRVARTDIAIRLLDEGMALSYQVDAPGVDVQGGATSCRRLTARRVRCQWKISAYACDEDYANCEDRPAARTLGVAWATKRSGRTVVLLGSDSQRRGLS